MIKSGDEWISSIEVENEAPGCPGVAEAAVISLPHPKWNERLLLILVREQNTDVDKQTVLAYLYGKIATPCSDGFALLIFRLAHSSPKYKNLG